MSGAKVMVVDDEPMIRRLVGSILAGNGYKVVDVDSPEEAITALDSHPGIDLLVTDVMMPNITGKQLAATLLERRPGLRVLFMSGYDRDTVDGEYVASSGFIRKPFRIPDLLESVQQMLA